MARTDCLIAPIGVLALFTIGVMFWAAIERFLTRSPIQASVVPTRAMVVQQGLVELPLLFYVVCLASIAAQRSIVMAVPLAWSFVAFRIAHALIQLTYDWTSHRVASFGISSLLLAAMWVSLLLS